MNLILIDDDFNCTSCAVNFPINATSATLNITLIDDTVYEGNESFTVTIDPSSKLPPNVTVGVTNEATVTIVDDDGKYRIYPNEIRAHINTWA